MSMLVHKLSESTIYIVTVNNFEKLSLIFLLQSSRDHNFDLTV